MYEFEFCNTVGTSRERKHGSRLGFWRWVQACRMCGIMYGTMYGTFASLQEDSSPAFERLIYIFF